MSWLRSLALVAAFGTATGCTQADILRLDNTPRPHTNLESIQLIGQEPTRPFAVIAIVSANGATVAQARSRLVKEAARLGGHAVLFDAGSVTRVVDGDISLQQLSGKVIVYTQSTGSN